MYRIIICLFLCACVGCSNRPVPNAPDRGPETEVEDGGIVENADRDKAEAFFVALRKVRSVDEEEKLLTEFGEWLGGNEYKIRVEVKNGKHDLSCPYFPPVTPSASHSFFDIRNLELLPRMDDGE